MYYYMDLIDMGMRLMQSNVHTPTTIIILFGKGEMLQSTDGSLRKTDQRGESIYIMHIHVDVVTTFSVCNNEKIESTHTHVEER